MTTWFVKQGSKNGDGSEAAPFGTLAAAVQVAGPGDVVVVGAGIYREKLRPPAGTTWVAAPGETVIIDGGWNGKTDVGGNRPAMILITAVDVVINGLRVVNAPGDAIAVGQGGHNATLLNCATDVAYSGGIICNAGETLRGVTIDGCAVLRSGMGWLARGRKGGVSGAINLIRCEGATVTNTVSAYNWGEGLNVGKGTRNSTVSGCVSFDNAHFCLGINLAQDCVVKNCILFLTGYEPRYVGNVWPGGLVIGDEEGLLGENFEHSKGIQVRGNLIVNCGVGIGVRNNVSKTGYDTQLVGTYIERNTVVAGPQTRTAINVGVNERGRPHRDSYVRYNAIDMSGAADDAEPATGDATNVTWHDNAWTRLPAADFRHGDDVIGFQLIAPLAALANEFPAAGHTLDIDNYRPRAGSAVAAAGLGALPVGPVGPPPPEEEPPGVNWDSLIERAASIGMQVATQAEELQGVRSNIDALKERHAVLSLSNEQMAMELGELLLALEEYKQAAESGEE